MEYSFLFFLCVCMHVKCSTILSLHKSYLCLSRLSPSHKNFLPLTLCLLALERSFLLHLNVFVALYLEFCLRSCFFGSFCLSSWVSNDSLQIQLTADSFCCWSQAKACVSVIKATKTTKQKTYNRKTPRPLGMCLRSSLAKAGHMTYILTALSQSPTVSILVFSFDWLGRVFSFTVNFHI